MKKPLASRMRPNKLGDIIGQESLVGENGFLTNCLKSDAVISMILYGPSGSGKTTIAEAFAKTLNINYYKLNAVTSNKEEMTQAIREAKLFSPSIIIMDEVHRLNKDRQDLFLPYLEEGDFYFIGATTANPLISINKAIRSRTRLLEVKPLTPQEIIIGLRRALVSSEGLNDDYQFEDDALEYIAMISGGDLRYAYNILESAALGFNKTDRITKLALSKLNLGSNTLSDLDEDEHYDTVSAFQKSIRGSEVDAAIYYLAKLLSSNDLEAVIRRLLVTAYEDVGLANPPAVDRCYAATRTALLVGLPEAMIPLSFTVTELALSPKSKSTTNAIYKAMDEVKRRPTHVRDYLRYTPVNVEDIDKYPYDRSDLHELIEYLPAGLEKMRFYEPNRESKYEANLAINYDRLKNQLRETSIRLLKTRFPKK